MRTRCCPPLPIAPSPPTGLGESGRPRPQIRLGKYCCRRLPRCYGLHRETIKSHRRFRRGVISASGSGRGFLSGDGLPTGQQDAQSCQSPPPSPLRRAGPGWRRCSPRLWLLRERKAWWVRRHTDLLLTADQAENNRFLLPDFLHELNKYLLLHEREIVTDSTPGRTSSITCDLSWELIISSRSRIKTALKCSVGGRSHFAVRRHRTRLLAVCIRGVFWRKIDMTS